MADTVDVLIVGAGASGAAVAWSLAETRMRIVCLEQGDWMNPLEYPSTGRDWEARAFSDMSISPNRRQRVTDRQFAHLGGELQRRGRQHDSLRRAFPTLPSV